MELCTLEFFYKWQHFCIEILEISECTHFIPASICLHFEDGTLADTWVHYEDLILHFCKVSKALELFSS